MYRIVNYSTHKSLAIEFRVTVLALWLNPRCA